MDVQNETIAIAVAWAGRAAPEYRGEIKNTPKAVVKLARRLCADGELFLFVVKQDRAATTCFVSGCRWGLIAWWWHRPGMSGSSVIGAMRYVWHAYSDAC